MKSLFIAIALLYVMILAPSTTSAECRCVCIEGEVQAICSSTLDIAPICSPRICPITPPSVEPIQPPSIPPLGTTNCVQRQVYNEETAQYEWQEVCY